MTGVLKTKQYVYLFVIFIFNLQALLYIKNMKKLK